MEKELTQRCRNECVVEPLGQAVKTRGYQLRIEMTVDIEVAGRVSGLSPAKGHRRGRERRLTGATEGGVVDSTAWRLGDENRAGLATEVLRRRTS